MKKELINLANNLDKRGLLKEADFVDGLIQKIGSETIRKMGKLSTYRKVHENLDEDSIEVLSRKARFQLSALTTTLVGPGAGCGLSNGGLLPEDSCQEVLRQLETTQAYLRKIQDIAQLV
tara:strand:- start:5650 stop:6009 length:360 start_codon:yes stop_codon:yes gene_type:complete